MNGSCNTVSQIGTFYIYLFNQMYSKSDLIPHIINILHIIEAKKMHKCHISGRRKKYQPEKKTKLEVWHSYRKNSLNHTSVTQKSDFLVSNF